MLLLIVCLVSCESNVKVVGQKNVYKTTYTVYYATYNNTTRVIYTKSEVSTCSFNGTNYLFENEEELFSSTAPIEIIEVIKYDKDGNPTKINI